MALPLVKSWCYQSDGRFRIVLDTNYRYNASVLQTKKVNAAYEVGASIFVKKVLAFHDRAYKRQLKQMHDELQGSIATKLDMAFKPRNPKATTFSPESGGMVLLQCVGSCDSTGLKFEAFRDIQSENIDTSGVFQIKNGNSSLSGLVNTKDKNNNFIGGAWRLVNGFLTSGEINYLPSQYAAMLYDEMLGAEMSGQLPPGETLKVKGYLQAARDQTTFKALRLDLIPEHLLKEASLTSDDQLSGFDFDAAVQPFELRLHHADCKMHIYSVKHFLELIGICLYAKELSQPLPEYPGNVFQDFVKQFKEIYKNDNKQSKNNNDGEGEGNSNEDNSHGKNQQSDKSVGGNDEQEIIDFDIDKSKGPLRQKKPFVGDNKGKDNSDKKNSSGGGEINGSDVQKLVDKDIFKDAFMKSVFKSVSQYYGHPPSYYDSIVSQYANTNELYVIVDSFSEKTHDKNSIIQAMSTIMDIWTNDNEKMTKSFLKFIFTHYVCALGTSGGDKENSPSNFFLSKNKNKNPKNILVPEEKIGDGDIFINRANQNEIKKKLVEIKNDYDKTEKKDDSDDKEIDSKIFVGSVSKHVWERSWEDNPAFTIDFVSDTEPPPLFSDKDVESKDEFVDKAMKKVDPTQATTSNWRETPKNDEPCIILRAAFEPGDFDVDLPYEPTFIDMTDNDNYLVLGSTITPYVLAIRAAAILLSLNSKDTSDNSTSDDLPSSPSPSLSSKIAETGEASVEGFFQAPQSRKRKLIQTQTQYKSSISLTPEDADKIYEYYNKFSGGKGITYNKVKIAELSKLITAKIPLSDESLKSSTFSSYDTNNFRKKYPLLFRALDAYRGNVIDKSRTLQLFKEYGYTHGKNVRGDGKCFYRSLSLVIQYFFIVKQNERPDYVHNTEFDLDENKTIHEIGIFLDNVEEDPEIWKFLLKKFTDFLVNNKEYVQTHYKLITEEDIKRVTGKAEYDNWWVDHKEILLIRQDFEKIFGSDLADILRDGLKGLKNNAQRYAKLDDEKQKDMLKKIDENDISTCLRFPALDLNLDFDGDDFFPVQVLFILGNHFIFICNKKIEGLDEIETMFQRLKLNTTNESLGRDVNEILHEVLNSSEAKSGSVKSVLNQKQRSGGASGGSLSKSDEREVVIENEHLVNVFERRFKGIHYSNRKALNSGVYAVLFPNLTWYKDNFEKLWRIGKEKSILKYVHGREPVNRSDDTFLAKLYDLLVESDATTRRLRGLVRPYVVLVRGPGDAALTTPMSVAKWTYASAELLLVEQEAIALLSHISRDTRKRKLNPQPTSLSSMFSTNQIRDFVALNDFVKVQSRSNKTKVDAFCSAMFRLIKALQAYNDIFQDSGKTQRDRVAMARFDSERFAAAHELLFHYFD